MKQRQTIAVDFDGVLHAYTSPWTAADVILDGPTPGAQDAVRDWLRHFDVLVFSTRAHQQGGAAAIDEWLERHGFPLVVEGGGTLRIWEGEGKPPALVYVDDRAYRFDGQTWPSAERLRNLRPWNRPHAGATGPQEDRP